MSPTNSRYTEPEVAHVGKYAHEIEGGCDTYQSNLQVGAFGVFDEFDVFDVFDVWCV